IRATLLNLLLNAAQAMNGRGRIEVSLTRHGDLATIQIRDNGPGIPPELREQVFEPFFTTKARGGGLGLPIALRVAELHGGTLTLAPGGPGAPPPPLGVPTPAAPHTGAGRAPPLPAWAATRSACGFCSPNFSIRYRT